MKKICFVATIPAVIHSFLRGHIRACAETWTVRVCSHPQGSELIGDLDAQFIPVPFERKVSPSRDLSSLIQLIRVFRRERFDMVHSIMPKTGLLTMMAAWAGRVPCRLHTFTGQVWATRRGWRREMLKQFDRLIVHFATHILIDSPSQRDFLVSEKILPESKAIVIGDGSICGVDDQIFHPDLTARRAVREELSISEECIVILFLGRLNRDKGIIDLAAAFAEISAHRSGLVLALVGPEEDVSFEKIRDVCGNGAGHLRRVDFTPNPERYMAMADIFCLPSYREGFGQVIIEAAASGIPTVASRIYGIVDAVADGDTGLLFTAGDVPALAEALLRLIDNSHERQRMGVRARERALARFSSRKITDQLVMLYRHVLGEHRQTDIVDEHN
ncbi:MAG: glycosyltransferase family 4 protein [Gammaproteobacteria bacterium]